MARRTKSIEDIRAQRNRLIRALRLRTRKNARVKTPTATISSRANRVWEAAREYEDNIRKASRSKNVSESRGYSRNTYMGINTGG